MLPFPDNKAYGESIPPVWNGTNTAVALVLASPLKIESPLIVSVTVAPGAAPEKVSVSHTNASAYELPVPTLGIQVTPDT